MCITLFSLTGQVCKKSGWSTLVINIHCINNTYKKRGTTDMTSKPLDVSSLKNAYPLLNKITGLKPVFWENPHLKTMSHLPDFMISDRKSTRLNSSHVSISYAVFCLKK